MQRLLQMSTVCVRVGSHAPLTGRSKLLELWNQCSITVKQLFRLVTAHPVFQLMQPLCIVLYIGHWHLMRTPESFQLVAADLCGPGPTLWASQYDHRPARPLGLA